jgi:hypothetical protein
MIACKKGSLEIVQLLVKQNADISNALKYSTTEEIKTFLQSK